MTPPGSDPEVLALLAEDGLLRREGDRYRTTRRWQSAMARAAASLAQQDPDRELDLRFPIVQALLELYGDRHDDAALTRFVAALIRVEAAELAPSPPVS